MEDPIPARLVYLGFARYDTASHFMRLPCARQGRGLIFPLTDAEASWEGRVQRGCRTGGLG